MLQIFRRSLVFATALLAASSISASALGTPTSKPAFVLNTEDYPPYQTRGADGEITGDAVKVIKELFRRAGLSIEIKLDTWEKSFEAAKKNPGQGVFSANRSAEREKLFQWVGPVSVTRAVFLAKKSNAIKLNKVQDALQYKIGGVRDDAKAQFLERAGLKVDKVDLDAKNALRLKKGEIDLWATGYISGMTLAKAAGLTDVEEVFVFSEDEGYLALNIETSTKTVLELNRILDLMKSEGVLDSALKFKQ